MMATVLYTKESNMLRIITEVVSQDEKRGENQKDPPDPGFIK